MYVIHSPKSRIDANGTMRLAVISLGTDWRVRYRLLRKVWFVDSMQQFARRVGDGAGLLHVGERESSDLPKPLISRNHGSRTRKSIYRILLCRLLS